MRALIPLLAVLLMMLAGCRTRYVALPSASVSADTLRSLSVRVDSVYRSDSTFVIMKGDTIRIIERRTDHRYRIVRDTVASVRVDSVRVSVPVPVPAALTLWQRTRLATWPVLFAVTILALVWLLIRLALRRRSP